MRIPVGEKSPRQQLREMLTRQITLGNYPQGMQLPALEEFARQHRVSRTTAKRVFGDLLAAGIISCRQGARATVGSLTDKTPAHKLVLLCCLSEDFVYQHGPWSWLWHQGVALVCGRRNINIIPTANTILRQSELIKQVDGVILDEVFRTHPEHHALLEDLGKPYVVVKSFAGVAPSNNVVSIDYRNFFEQCALYILSLGIKHTVFLSGGSASPGSDVFDPHVRHSTLFRTLAEQGVGMENFLVEPAQDELPEAERHLQLWDRFRPPFAVVSYGDWSARYVLEEGLRRGLRPKIDFTVIGSSGLPEADRYSPPLSSIAIDFEAVGKTVCRMLAEQWTRNVRELPPVAIPTSLCIRQS